MKYTQLSTANPLVKILLMLVSIIIFLYILRVLNTTIGFGANAHVGRLRGSVTVEGFKLWGMNFGNIGKKKKKKKKKKAITPNTPSIDVLARQYASEALTYYTNIKSAKSEYDSAALAGDTVGKTRAYNKYQSNLSNLLKVADLLSGVKKIAEEDAEAAAFDQKIVDDLNTLLTDSTTGYLTIAKQFRASTESGTDGYLGLNKTCNNDATTLKKSGLKVTGTWPADGAKICS